MKNLFVICLMVMLAVETHAQGTIELSNINRQPVTLNGRPVDSDWKVSFALPDGTLLGGHGNVLAQGIFSAGVQTLDGIAGEVNLSVAAWDSNSPFLIGLSDPFTVTLGTMDNPASIPSDFSGVHIVIPEPSGLGFTFIGIVAIATRYRKTRTSHFS